MEGKNLVQRGHSLSVDINVTNRENMRHFSKCSSEYFIGDAVSFQMKVSGSFQINCRPSYLILVSICFKKACPKDGLSYIGKLSSKMLNMVKKHFPVYNGVWYLVFESDNPLPYAIDIQLEIDFVSTVGSFSSLYDDSELPDIELRGEACSIRMHRTVLAACSPVFRKMLAGTWRETGEGTVNVPGASQGTLRHFKDYVYLGLLPERGLEQVMLLASLYMMPELERKCVFRLVDSLTNQNACYLLKFAVKNEMKALLFAILEFIEGNGLNVKDMRDQYDNNNIKEDSEDSEDDISED